MNLSTITTLFHFSFAVSDLDRAREFYGELLGCPEGRKMPGRADFNFFGHHIVAHLSPADVVGEKGTRINNGETPLRHFGVVVPLAEFEKISSRLMQNNVEFLSQPSVRQKGSVREQMLMVCSDGCGNAIEFKGLRNITDVYAVPETEKAQA